MFLKWYLCLFCLDFDDFEFDQQDFNQCNFDSNVCDFLVLFVFCLFIFSQCIRYWARYRIIQFSLGNEFVVVSCVFVLVGISIVVVVV